MEHGVVGVSVWNFLIIGAVALVFVGSYNHFVAGKSVAGKTFPRV